MRTERRRLLRQGQTRMLREASGSAILQALPLASLLIRRSHRECGQIKFSWKLRGITLLKNGCVNVLKHLCCLYRDPQ